jgi:hypothetical protein
MKSSGLSTRTLQREPRLRHVVFAPPSAKNKPLRVWSRELVIGVGAVGLVHSRPGEGRVRVRAHPPACWSSAAIQLPFTLWFACPRHLGEHEGSNFCVSRSSLGCTWIP